MRVTLVSGELANQQHQVRSVNAVHFFKAVELSIQTIGMPSGVSGTMIEDGAQLRSACASMTPAHRNTNVAFAFALHAAAMASQRQVANWSR